MYFRNYHFIVVMCLILTGCGQDIFGLSCRPVAGSYCLQRWEDGKTYYLEDKSKEGESGGGVLDGVVEKIGWAGGSYIVARRHPIFGGDKAGWMVVDVKRKVISGPYDDDSLRELPQTKGMIFYSPDEAWSRLR